MEGDVRQKEITKDLDRYISSKRKGGLFGMFGKSESDDEVAMHPYVKTYDDEPAAVTPSPEPVAAAAAEEETPQPKKGFLSRWFGEAEPEVEAAPVQAPAEDADLREVARIALAFLRQTDADALARIKSSPDFEKFKEILRRRNIIK